MVIKTECVGLLLCVCVYIYTHSTLKKRDYLKLFAK